MTDCSDPGIRKVFLGRETPGSTGTPKVWGYHVDCGNRVCDDTVYLSLSAVESAVERHRTPQSSA